jgi:hypothetical protein
MQCKVSEFIFLALKYVPLGDKYLTLSEVIQKSINMLLKYL